MSTETGLYRQLLLVIVLLLAPAAVWAEESRLALVIGNSNYEDSPLVNPQNDANDMAEVLEDLGFKVILRTDADRRGMARAIRDFGRELKAKRGVGLFYYAGHGMQLNNRNFLIPVDTAIEAEDEVPFDSIDVGSVLAKMESAGNSLNMLILDACRNNPFQSQFRSGNRGLARVEAPVGSLVVYATAPGNIAADGDGRNGVFTGALLKQLRTKGLSLTETVRRTRAAVVKATGGKQVPWETSSLLQDYYFDTEPVATDIAEAAPAAQTTAQIAEPVATQAPAQTTEPVATQAPAQTTEPVATQAPAQTTEPVAAQAPTQTTEPAATQATAQTTEPIAPPAPSQTSEPVTAQAPAETTEPVAVQTPAQTTEPVAAQAPAQTSEPPVVETVVQPPAEIVATNDSELTEPQAEPDREVSIEPLAMLSPDATQPRVPLATSTSTNPRTGRLTVSVVPADARVRIMNIVEKYKPGIELAMSRSYDVYVTKPGYVSFRKNIDLAEPDQNVPVILRQKDPFADAVTQRDPEKEIPAITKPSTASSTSRSIPATVALPGGLFDMGCSKGDSQCESYEKPAHQVNVRPFAMTRTEITVAQFALFIQSTGYQTDAEKNANGQSGCYIWSEGGGISRSSARWTWSGKNTWENPGYKQEDDFPVTCVSWNDAKAYARWLSQRSGKNFTLPSEAEWEFAARAGTTSTYGAVKSSRGLCAQSNIADRTLSPSGSKWSDRVSCTDNFWFSAPVSSFQPNAMGLHDMQGNVWEWVEDTWASGFEDTRRDGTAYTDGKSETRVLRGGAWAGDQSRARLSSRSRGDTTSRAAMTGFRLVVRN